MCGPYWSQWDKSDLDSWHGKDCYDEEEKDIDLDCDEDDDSEEDEDEGCPCGYHCMDCLGLSWRDFM